MARHGEGEDGRHRGCGLQARGDAAFRGRCRGRGRVDGAGKGICSAHGRSVPNVDDVARHGEGEGGRHRGYDLQAKAGRYLQRLVSRPWACRWSWVGVGHSQQLSVPSVDDMAVHGEGEDGRHRGYGLQARGELPSEAGIEAVGVSMVPGWCPFMQVALVYENSDKFFVAGSGVKPQNEYFSNRPLGYDFQRVGK